MASPISDCFTQKQWIAGFSFMGSMSIFWTIYGAHIGEIDFSAVFGGLATVSWIVVGAILLIGKSDLRRAVTITVMLALFILSVEAPFFLHFYKGLDWNTSAIPFFFAPIFLAMALDMIRRDKSVTL